MSAKDTDACLYLRTLRLTPLASEPVAVETTFPTAVAGTDPEFAAELTASESTLPFPYKTV